MRLVCPNCEAKYEVPDDAIPDTGRDVQCANCGHAWFQMRQRPVVATQPEPVTPAAAAAVEEAPPPVASAPEAAEVADPAPEAAVAASETAPEATDAPEPPAAETPPAEPVAEIAADSPVGADQPDLPETTAAESEPVTPAAEVAADSVTTADVAETAPEPVAEPAASADDAAAEPADAPAEPAPVPYAVDDSVLAILREEAEREANARRAEARPLETQPDLGLETAGKAERVAEVAPVAAALAEADGKPSARRDLLPDVEEINSTLRPSEYQVEEGVTEGAAPVAPEPRRGFRSGFLTVMTIAIIGAAVYVAAPTLSTAVPSLAGPLDSYVGFVDGFRLQLDGLMRSATVSLNGS